MYVILCYSLKKKRYLRENGEYYKVVKRDSSDFRPVSIVVGRLRGKVKEFHVEDELSAHAFIDDVKRHLGNVFLGVGRDFDETIRYIMNCSNVVVNELSRRLMTSSKKEEMYLILIYDFVNLHLFIIHSSLREALTDRYDWVRTTLDEALSNALRVALIYFRDDKLVVGYREISGISKGFRAAFGISVTARPEVGSIQVYGNAVVGGMELSFPLRCDLEIEEFIDMVKGMRRNVSIKGEYLMLRGTPYLKITEIQVAGRTFRDVKRAIDYVLKYEAYFVIGEIIRSFKENVKVDVYGSKFLDGLDVVISASSGDIVLSKGGLFDKYGILLIFHNKDLVEADTKLLEFIISNAMAGEPVRLLFYDIAKRGMTQDYLEDDDSLFIGSLNLYGVRHLIPSQTMGCLEAINKFLSDCTSKSLRGLLYSLALNILSFTLRKEYALTIADFLDKLAIKIIHVTLGEVISESESPYLEFKDSSFFSKDLSEIVDKLVRKIAGARFKIIISASDDGRLSFLPSTHPLAKSDVRHSLENCLKDILRDYEVRVYAISADKGMIIIIFAFRST